MDPTSQNTPVQESQRLNRMTGMPDQAFYLRQEPVCALDPLLLIPRIEYAQSIFACIQGSSRRYTLVILDMINFHVINDVFGYEVGDSVLQQFIVSLRSALPRGSISMRFRHGDEFLFFLPLAEPDAHALFETRQRFSREVRYPQLASEETFQVSFRFATMPLDQSGAEYRDLLRAAEARLRAVKGQGTPRNISKEA